MTVVALLKWCVVFAYVAAAGAAHAFSLPPFPLADVVTQAFAAAAQRPAPVPSGITRRDYLLLIAGTVEAFVPAQSMDPASPNYGKIIDPYAGEEIQYSTPCFANAAALLLKEQYYNSTYAECTEHLSRIGSDFVDHDTRSSAKSNHSGNGCSHQRAALRAARGEPGLCPRYDVVGSAVTPRWLANFTTRALSLALSLLPT